MDPLLRAKKEIQILIEFSYVGIFLLGIEILYKNVFKLIVEVARMSSFLTGSFSTEPLNQVV